jgi:hypothetical protein
MNHKSIIPLRHICITKAVFFNEIMQNFFCLLKLPICHLNELNNYVLNDVSIYEAKTLYKTALQLYNM